MISNAKNKRPERNVRDVYSIRSLY